MSFQTPLLSQEGQARSAGVVCSKSARSALLIDVRDAHRLLRLQVKYALEGASHFGADAFHSFHSQLVFALLQLNVPDVRALFPARLVEFGEDDGTGELEIPDSVNMSALIEAANEVDVLSAPINIPSHLNDDGDTTPPKHVAKEVVDKIRKFRNLIHPARALKEGYDPRTFTQQQHKELKEMYESVLHSLMYYL